jgi:iron complex outermembrane receptor protein
MKQFLYTLLSIFLVVNLSAQSIKGKIKKADGAAIEAATVSVLNTDRTSATDKQGDFSFTKILPGTYQLSVSSIGFATKLIEAKVTSNSVTELAITLTEQNRQLGEVVVTADKREGDILRAATSITALSARKIEDNRIWGLGDLAAIVPNYSYQELGVPYQQIQSIRGIQAFSENAAVSTYIDDVNNLDIQANGLALTDIERIEVLRGPQGTLFGRNAMGGVVNIYTKQPTNQTTGFVEVGAGNQGLQRYSAGFKTPIVKNKLFFGFTGLFQTKNGYFISDTTGTGATDGSVNGKRLGGEKNLYGNLYVKWLVSSRFRLTLNVKGQRDWSNNSSYMIAQPNDSIARANPDKLYVGRIGQDQRNVFNYSLVAKYTGNDFAVTSISAYQNLRLGYKNIYFPGYYSTFYDKGPGELLPPQEVYSQEIRISSNGDKRFQYTAGLYGFWQKSHDGDNVYELSPSDAAAYGMPDSSFVISRENEKNYGLAGYGELSYRLTDKFTVTAGLRYDYENKQVTFNGFGDAVFTNGVVTNYVPDTTAKGTYSALSPKLAVSYALSAHANVYATYTRGFRAGGINAQRFAASANAKQTFDPEHSDNYEIGYKTRLAQNKVSIAASAFFIHWRNMQLENIVAPFTYAMENVGNSQSMGLELEVSAIPVKGLELDGSVGLDKTKYENFALTRDDFTTGAETKIEVTGNSLSNTPGHTIYLAAQYELPITRKLKAILHGDIRNVGKFYTDMQNTIKQPTYTLLNTRAGFTYDKYGVFFWGQNLTSVRYLLYGAGDSSLGANVIMSSPATYGVTLTARFK